jgi:hypothetical protein
VVCKIEPQLGYFLVSAIELLGLERDLWGRVVIRVDLITEHEKLPRK